MRTYPIVDRDGRAFAFEIDNLQTLPPRCARLLRSIPGVSDVELLTYFWRFDTDARVNFRYQGQAFEVWEPYGDNSRYWIGPVDPTEGKPDITPIEDAFKGLQPPVWIVFDLLTLAPLRRVLRKRRSPGP